MDEPHSTASCKGDAGESRQAVRSIKQAVTARMTDLEVAGPCGAPSGFRIRNEHFVSGIDDSPAPSRPQRHRGRVIQHHLLQGSGGERWGEH